MATKENTAGIGVGQYYGPRNTVEGVGGEYNTLGSYKQAVLEITGTNYTTATAYLPAGVKVTEVLVEVTSAFALSGTTPTIVVGTDGSEATNGISISEAQAEATGLYRITSFNGTWADSLAAATTVGVALGGGTPTATTAGRAKLVIFYADV